MEAGEERSVVQRLREKGLIPIRIGVGGTVNNNGTFEAQNDATINNAFGGAATFANTGTFRKLAGSGGSTIISTSFNNGKTVEVQNGTYVIPKVMDDGYLMIGTARMAFRHVDGK